MTYFCPRCWIDLREDLARCPRCGLDIASFWNSKDRTEKLVLALGHREPATRLRAAYLLGRSRDVKGVAPLMELGRTTSEVYLAREAVRALGEIGGREALAFLRRVGRHHEARMVRGEARRALEQREGASSPSVEERP